MSEPVSDLSALAESLSARLSRIERILHLQALDPTSPEMGEDEMKASTQSNYCHGNSHASTGCVKAEAPYAR